MQPAQSGPAMAQALDRAELHPSAEPSPDRRETGWAVTALMRLSIQIGNWPNTPRSRKNTSNPPPIVASRWRLRAAITMVASPASK